jgi:hypothetical protein
MKIIKVNFPLSQGDFGDDSPKVPAIPKLKTRKNEFSLSPGRFWG